MQSVFGPGIAIVTRTDIANPTPVNVGFVNSLSIDQSATTKELYGQNQYPLDIARGTVKSTGKWVSAIISPNAWNNVFFGQSVQTGRILWAVDEAGQVPGSSTYTVQVSQHADFDADLGVRYADTGLPLMRVASGSEVAGKYSVAAGTYTFAAADASKNLLFTYSYTDTGGAAIKATNQQLGETPTFKLDYYTIRQTKPYIVRLYRCTSSKIAQAFKLEDFMMPEFEFGFFADDTGRVIDMYFAENA